MQYFITKPKQTMKPGAAPVPVSFYQAILNHASKENAVDGDIGADIINYFY